MAPPFDGTCVVHPIRVNHFTVTGLSLLAINLSRSQLRGSGSVLGTGLRGTSSHNTFRDAFILKSC